MLILLVVIVPFVSACSTSRCNRGEKRQSAAEASAALVPPAERTPASGCQLMMPFKHKVHGKLGNNRIHADEAVQNKLKSKGYGLMDPAGYEGGVGAYLEKIPVGSYGLVIDTATSFGSSGWASALFVIRTPVNYEIFKVLRTEVGGNDGILAMLDQLPNCH